MARRNHGGVELVVFIHTNSIHAEYKFRRGNHYHLCIILYRVGIDSLRLCSNSVDDIQFISYLDELSQFQSGPGRVKVDVDGILLSQHLASQNLGVIIGFENGIELRELVESLLGIVILLVQRGDIFLLFLEVGVVVLIVVLADQCLLLCPHDQVVHCRVEQEVHHRLVVGQHLSNLRQPVIIGSGIHVSHVLDSTEDHGSTVLLHPAVQYVVIVSRFRYIGAIRRYGLGRCVVVEGHRTIAVDIFGFLPVGIVADVELSVLPVHELSPAVTGAYQHVVEALVILYEIGEDVLLSVFHEILHL